MSKDKEFFIYLGKTLHASIQHGRDSVRKWEKFSDEELRILINDYQEYLGVPAYGIRNKIADSLVSEQDFRLTLKDAESESLENLEAGEKLRTGYYHNELMSKAPSKMTHPTGEFELLEDGPKEISMDEMFDHMVEDLGGRNLKLVGNDEVNRKARENNEY